jgi:hypothetical protein
MSDFKIVKLLDPININVNINPTGAYNPSTTYNIGDSVSYNNSSYIAIQTTTGNVPTNTAYWQLLASSSTLKLSTTARNNTGSTIPAGAVVYFSGASGNLPLIALAQANTEMTSSKTIGITAVAIANNATGEVVVSGLADNLNTSSFADGVALWLSPTVPGGLTITKPSAPDHMVFVGFVTRSHPTQGTIEVKIQNGFELQELHNVAINGITNGQIIQYESSTQLWKNHTLTKTDVGLGNVPNTDATNPANIVQTSSYRFVTDTEKSDWNSKEPGITPGTTAQYWRGDKSWQTLDKSAVGLGNVDNISDLSKDLNKFEKISKNIRSYPYSIAYSGGVLSSIIYTTGATTSIVKTFNFTGGVLTSIVLSGDLPTELAGITTKTFSYTAGKLTSLSYS